MSFAIDEKHVNKKILVLVADYPSSDGGIAMMYVHNRNIAYSQKGISVNVLNFSAKCGDVVDGIKVISFQEYKSNPYEKYDVLVLHAANIRQHYRFLLKFGKRFPKYIFFFHGHEVLKVNSVYPKPYPYMQKTVLKSGIQDLYDTFKLYTWRRFFMRYASKSLFIFVSHWMRNEFLKWTKLPEKILKDKSFVIYNSINELFERSRWNANSLKVYDFITIRGDWDGSKYSIDIVNELAKQAPDKKFLLIGQGHFFDHYDKANNLELLYRHLTPKEIIRYLNVSRCALMPTRTDAQGLMVCEMASFGIPVITSDISVCREVLSTFPNIAFIDNNRLPDYIGDLLFRLETEYEDVVNSLFFMESTIEKEICLINK